MLFCFILAATWSGPVTRDDPPSTPTLDALRAEARQAATTRPAEAQADRERINPVVVQHDRLVAGWRNPGTPPRLNLRPLNLPLPTLVDGAAQLVDDPANARLHSQRPGWTTLTEAPRRHLIGYLDAIAHHPDLRRLPALLELRASLDQRHVDGAPASLWDHQLAEAATLAWAADQIRAFAGREPPARPGGMSGLRFGLEWQLLDRFAEQLPADLRTIAYDALLRVDPSGPHNYEGQKLWELLIRLDPARGRREIIPHFAQPTGYAGFNLYVVFVLAHQPGPSPELAEAVRGWLARTPQLNPNQRADLEMVLFRADPARELGPTVAKLDAWVKTRQAGPAAPFVDQREPITLLAGLADVATPEADAALARFIFVRAIDGVTRMNALLALGRHRYGETPDLVARWVAEEPAHLQRALRENADRDWGDDARTIFAKIDAPR